MASRVTTRRGKTNRPSPASPTRARRSSVSLPDPDGPTTRTRVPGRGAVMKGLPGGIGAPVETVAPAIGKCGRFGRLVGEEAGLEAGRLALRLAQQRVPRSEEHTSELQSRPHLVCRLLLEKKKEKIEVHSSCI